MAKEVQFAGVSTATHYFTVKNAIGEWRRNTGAAFEAFNSANWTDYDFAATEYGTSAEFSGDFPALAAGVYNVSARRQTGGAPAQSDPVIAGGLMYWSGTVLVPVTAENFADALLGRNIAGGSSTGRLVKEAFAAHRNKVAFDVPGAGQFTVYGTDDVTPLWTGTYTTAAGNPVTVLDPA